MASFAPVAFNAILPFKSISSCRPFSINDMYIISCYALFIWYGIFAADQLICFNFVIIAVVFDVKFYLYKKIKSAEQLYMNPFYFHLTQCLWHFHGSHQHHLPQ